MRWNHERALRREGCRPFVLCHDNPGQGLVDTQEQEEGVSGSQDTEISLRNQDENLFLHIVSEMKTIHS